MDSKKKIALLTRADKNNLKYYEMMKNSLRKFHGPDEVELLLWDEEKIKTYNDPNWFYRASPTILKECIEKYEMCVALDSDQIIMGKLDHIFNGDFDIGTVLNINRVDPPKYGLVQFQGIPPSDYFNNGLVAIRNTPKGKEFINEWHRLCHSKYFDRFQFREQDILNILAHYGNYKVKCLDYYDKPNNIYCWFGLVAKGETMNAYLDKDNNVIVPVGKDNYPDHEMTLKVWHTAGGAQEKKVNFRIQFKESLVDYINWLISDSTDSYAKST